MVTESSSEIREISREAVIAFFRELILTDWGYDDVKDADDKKVLTEYIGPHASGDYATLRFLKSKVFGESLSSKIREYALQIQKGRDRDENDGESLQLYDQFIRFFNPDIIHSHFVKYESEGTPNLFVLERQSLNDGEKAELVHSSEAWLKVLYNLQEEMKEKRGHGWAWHLSTTLEYVIARADPEIDRDFVRQGKVVGFVQVGMSESYHLPRGLEGMVVNGFDGNKHSDDSPSIILTNAFSPERFAHLIGQTVRYHFVDVFYNSPELEGERSNLISGTLIPHGKLVSTQTKAD